MVDFVERNPEKRPSPKPTPAAGRPKPRKIHENDLQVSCAGCGRTFGVLPALAGSEAVCPGCSKPVQIPVAKDPSAAGLKKPEEAAPLRGKPRAVAGPGEKKAMAAEQPGTGEKKPSIRKVREKVDLKTQPKCPECEAVLEADAVLCVKCGYDLRKKQQNVTVRKKSMNPVIPVVILLALLGGSYVVYEFVLKPKDEETTTPAPKPSSNVAPEPDAEPVLKPATADEPTAAVEREPVIEKPAIAAEPEPKPESEPVADAKPEPVVEEPVVVDPREEIRQLMSDKLVAQYPVAGLGESVSLITLDGVEHVGTLAAIEGDSIRLTQDGLDISLPMENLERLSRARLDFAYRNDMIDQLTDKYMARKAAAN